MLKESRNWLLNWFSSIHKWQGQIVPPSRYVWLRCFGVPLNLWSEKTFLSIGGLWGDVISVDDNTLKSLSFEEGRLFIATDIMDRVDEEVELKFRERSIKIRVAEEIPSNVGMVNKMVQIGVEDPPLTASFPPPHGLYSLRIKGHVVIFFAHL